MAVDYDARYRKGYAYGKEPNEFVRVIASTLLPPATRPLEVLSLGEGQGRNVVHLAALGHQCTAVDLSAVGLAKTEALASERHVGSRVTTIHADLCHYDPLGGAAEARWDVVLSIFCALPAEPRRRLHRACATALRPGGLFVIECFAPAHASLGTAEHGKMWSRAGPDAALLVGAAELVADFQGVLEMVRCEEVARRVDEGRFHRGPAIVTQLVGRRPGGGGSPRASALPPTPPSFPPNVRPPTIEVAPPPPLPFRASMDRLVGAVAAAGPGAETALELAQRAVADALAQPSPPPDRLLSCAEAAVRIACEAALRSHTCRYCWVPTTTTTTSTTSTNSSSSSNSICSSSPPPRRSPSSSSACEEDALSLYGSACEEDALSLYGSACEEDEEGRGTCPAPDPPRSSTARCLCAAFDTGLKKARLLREQADRKSEPASSRAEPDAAPRTRVVPTVHWAFLAHPIELLRSTSTARLAAQLLHAGGVSGLDTSELLVYGASCDVARLEALLHPAEGVVYLLFPPPPGTPAAEATSVEQAFSAALASWRARTAEDVDGANGADDDDDADDEGAPPCSRPRPRPCGSPRAALTLIVPDGSWECTRALVRTLAARVAAPTTAREAVPTAAHAAAPTTAPITAPVDLRYVGLDEVAVRACTSPLIEALHQGSGKGRLTTLEACALCVTQARRLPGWRAHDGAMHAPRDAPAEAEPEGEAEGDNGTIGAEVRCVMEPLLAYVRRLPSGTPSRAPSCPSSGGAKGGVQPLSRAPPGQLRRAAGADPAAAAVSGNHDGASAEPSAEPSAQHGAHAVESPGPLWNESLWNEWVSELQAAARAATARLTAVPGRTHALGLRQCVVCQSGLGTPHHMRAHLEGRRHCEAVARRHLLQLEVDAAVQAVNVGRAEGADAQATAAAAAVVFETLSSAVLRESVAEPPDVALAALQWAFASRSKVPSEGS